MNALTLEDRFTVTLPGMLAAADIRQRVEPTAKGRAYAECLRAAEAVKNCTESQEGRTSYGPLLEAAYIRQNKAADAFYALTGESFFSTDAERDGECIKDAGRE